MVFLRPNKEPKEPGFYAGLFWCFALIMAFDFTKYFAQSK